MLVGKTGGGKTSSMNTLLEIHPALTPDSASSQTTECEKKQGEFGFVIDTPGVHNTEIPDEKVAEEIINGIRWAAGGPQVFLYVQRPDPLTTEDYEAVKIIQKIFGEKSKDYTLVLFSRGDRDKVEISDEDRKSFVEEATSFKSNQDSIDQYYHFFDNTVKKSDQVSELLKKINNLVEKNKGKNYIKEIFENAKKEKQKMEIEGVTPNAAKQDDLLTSLVGHGVTLTAGEQGKEFLFASAGCMTDIVEKWVNKCSPQ